MTKRRIGLYTVRVWSNSSDNDPFVDYRVLEVLRSSGDSIAAISAAIESLGSEIVAAYEILDDSGCGVVVYPDWK